MKKVLLGMSGGVDSSVSAVILQKQGYEVIGLTMLLCENEQFTALEDAKNGKDPNNISPIITYSLKNNITAYWFGDLLTDYMTDIKDNVDWIEADIVFASHHGRSSGSITNEILEKIKPKIIIIGEAPSENLDYYTGYDTITQNTAKDILIECGDTTADFYVSNPNYKTGPSCLKFIVGKNIDGYTYIGSLEYNE